jgi:lambda family phage tail tape measure protein
MVEQLLDRTSSRAAQSKAAALDLALNERILQAKKDGNEAEEASLENLRPVIKLRGELAALTEFQKMLVQNEAKIVGKSLTQAQFKERLQLANQKMAMAGIDLENANIDLKKKEFEEGEKILEQQQAYERTLEDIRIKNGEIGDEEIRRIEKKRQYQDILNANPSLSQAQKGTIQQAINAAPTDVLSEKLATLRKEAGNLSNLKTIAIDVSSTIGDAFSTAFQGIINGSMSVQDALGGMFKSIGESFVKMAAEIIAKQIVLITLGFIMKALGLISGVASAGNAAGAAAFSPGNAAGLDAIPGQAFNLPQLSGTMMNGSEIGAKAFAGPLGNGFAKGGAFSSGMRRFATGGIVNGPTLFPFADGGAMQMGLMGEAGPEAIMPLQRGADGSLGVRAAMGGNGMGGSSSPILNMNFETSTINGVEYVSRDQLELAMAQTRRQASRDGANKGMAMTLDKIQQSPQTRRRIGM